jgi:hypothetical protein
LVTGLHPMGGALTELQSVRVTGTRNCRMVIKYFHANLKRSSAGLSWYAVGAVH